ncbi:MAG TPA: hypothetical protein VGF79_00995 [Bacteroidia bacterium]
MAKGLPYFKFIPTEWLTGDISVESFEAQGLFISICALYWQRDGKLSIEDVNRRYKKPTALQELTDRYFSVNEGFLSIKFLDEQLEERQHISSKNSDNGKKGGRPKHLKTQGEKPTANRPLTDRIPNGKPKKANKEEEKELELEEDNKDKGQNKILPLTIEDRQLVFKEKLKPFREAYSVDMLKAFFMYWTEMNENGKKMRFEKESTFEISRRLITWKNNEKNFSKNHNNGKATITDNLSTVDNFLRAKHGDAAVDQIQGRLGIVPINNPPENK